MNVFIFQARPDRYDLRDDDKLVPGQFETWYATRYRSRMSPGDIVLFWLSGNKDIRGLYGWGELTSKPHLEDNWDSYGVDVVYREKFKHHIPISKIMSNEVLANLLVVRAAQATNFLIEDHEKRELQRLINDCGENPPKMGVDNEQ
jgi:hypothetical protein